MPIKVGMASLGCSKNQVDAEIMLAKLKDAGYELCADSGLCDVIIINTCGFIEAAKKESIENILEFVALKEEGRIRAVVITGCLAERYRDEVAKEIPEADVILGIGRNSEIVESIEAALAGVPVRSFGEKDELPLEGERFLANLPYFAYLKVADGCDNCCSYCAIPLIRGSFRSRKMENIVAEAKLLASRGVRELNLIAQDTTRYGEDIYGKLMLPELLKELCKIEELRWIRLLYCYPERITDELLDVIAAQDKIVKYIDMPVQHCDAGILAAMNRSGDETQLLALLAKIRQKIPAVTLRTTLIAGFPGESDAQFETLCNFVKAARFDRLGCFAYSQEEDTPAAAMDGQLDEDVKQRRSEVIMEVQMDIAAEKSAQYIGQSIEVLTEGFDRIAESWYGRSAADAPDIDTKVFFSSVEKLAAGDFVAVKITDSMECDLLGERV